MKKRHPKCLREVGSSSLWHNQKIKIPLRKEWYKNGINTIGDVLNDDLPVIWFSECIECNFIERESIKKRFQKRNVHYEYVKRS